MSKNKLTKILSTSTMQPMLKLTYTLHHHHLNFPLPDQSAG